LLNTDQLVPSTAAVYHWDSFAWSNLLPELPALAKLAYYVDLNLTNSAYIFSSHNATQSWAAPEDVLAHEGSTAAWMQTSPLSVNYFARNAEVTPVQPTVSLWVPFDEPETRFDFASNVIASAVEVLAAYISESERKAREFLNRFYRKNILSSAVSKDGHLPFLVPRYRQVCVETAAKDQVVHLEVITLAEEHESPNELPVGPMLMSGEGLWKRLRSRLSRLVSYALNPFLTGFTAGGLNLANAALLTRY
jgi:hypothetical protein